RTNRWPPGFCQSCKGASRPPFRKPFFPATPLLGNNHLRQLILCRETMTIVRNETKNNGGVQKVVRRKIISNSSLRPEVYGFSDHKVVCKRPLGASQMTLDVT